MNDHSKPLESSFSGLSGERRAAIRARLEQYPPCEAYQDETEDDPITVYVCGKCDRNEDTHIIRDLLAAVDQITLERDELKDIVTQQARVDAEQIAKLESMWQRSSASNEALRQRAEQAEAALVVITQRQEQAFKAGYHCRWHREQGVYCFDPMMSPGDPDGAYQAWLQALAQADKDFGLLGSAVPEDSTR